MHSPPHPGGLIRDDMEALDVTVAEGAIVSSVVRAQSHRKWPCGWKRCLVQPQTTGCACRMPMTWRDCGTVTVIRAGV